MFDNTSHANLSDLGEFGLIDHLTKNIKIHHSSTVEGIGDDAAILDFKDQQVVVTTDMLVEGIHFDVSYVPLQHLGYKAIAVNLSDVAAMNCFPTQVTVSLSISSKYTLEAVEAIYSGIRAACDFYQVDIVGGDTVSSAAGLSISVTAIGVNDANRIVKRSGAKDKDLICVSGDLGAAYLGLQVLEREKAVFKAAPEAQPDLEGFDYLLERQLKPEPRIDIVKQLAELDVVPTSMIDISDGLASELKHICKASNVGCRIYEHKIPIDPLTISTAEEFNSDPTISALNGGEDYELLFTIDAKDLEKVQKIKDISPVGYITDVSEGQYMQVQSGNLIELKAQGWNAFNQE